MPNSWSPRDRDRWGATRVQRPEPQVDPGAVPTSSTALIWTRLVLVASNHWDPRKLNAMWGIHFPRCLYVWTQMLPDSAHPNVAKTWKDDYTGSADDISQCQDDGLSAWLRSVTCTVAAAKNPSLMSSGPCIIARECGTGLSTTQVLAFQDCTVTSIRIPQGVHDASREGAVGKLWRHKDGGL